MRRTIYWLASYMCVLSLFPAGSALAQKALPKVPITYAGDTDQTILRRAEWMEGARKEGELAWWATITPGEANQIIAEFNKVYPFLKVSYWRGNSPELGTKLEAQFTSSRFDVDLSSGGGENNFPRWREMQMLEKFADIIPGIEKIDKRMYSRFGDTARPGHNIVTPQYNTNLVSANQLPKSWDDFLDPKWKGQIGLATQVSQWARLAVVEDGWGVEKTQNYLAGLKKQEPVWGRDLGSMHALVVAGEFKVLTWGYLRYVLQSQKKGSPVDWIRVEPIMLSGPNIIMLKKAPHPNAARLFLEWLLSPQGLATYERVTFFGVAFSGTGTQVSRLLQGLKLLQFDEEVEMKAVKAGLYERFAAVLGVKPE